MRIFYSEKVYTENIRYFCLKKMRMNIHVLFCLVSCFCICIRDLHQQAKKAALTKVSIALQLPLIEAISLKNKAKVEFLKFKLEKKTRCTSSRLKSIKTK
jgi:hypothetical protein